MSPSTELITRYINGELSPADKAAFEAQINSNAELKKEYELQLKLIEGIKRMGLKKQLASSFKKVKTTKVMTKAAIGLVVTLAVLGAVLLIKNQSNKAPNEVAYELNEEGKPNWSEADKRLESQLFRINPDRDTIIETQQGIVIAVPATSFEHSSGEGITGTFDLEIKEALTAAEIMKAGLSTLSNGRLLETGGMFYINARQGNENLKVNRSKPLNVNVPVNNDKNDMMLFKGERLADGSINWVEPKPMKRRLTTVDITKLNFYPEHFLDSLKAMGFNIKNKTLTDSIYYSFGGCGEFLSDEASAYSFDEAISEPKPVRRQRPDGKLVFKQNCAVCHTLSDQKLTGPGLQGIADRVPKGDWLRRYILNNEKLLKAGDPYATKVFNENGKAAMTIFEGQLSDADVNALIRYITGKSEILIDERPVMECSEIAPARIRAIWDKQFNHTILATKAFEERLKVIFKTCDPRLLSLYIKNLDHDLYELDSTAATLTGGELQKAFEEFAGRRDGGVEISDERSLKLQSYFEEKQAAYSQATVQAMRKLYDSENMQSALAFQKRNQQALEQILRSSATFGEELELNMDEAYRQLGKKRSPPFSPDSYVSGDISQTGWNNVDRYVIESTTNRSTLDYTDPESGKKAVIRYEPVSVVVADAGDYDRLLCYMIPDKLSSFQLMKREGTAFKEKLNELMNYSLVTVGFKGKKIGYHEVTHAKAQSYTVTLSPIDEKALDKKLNASFPLNQKSDLLKDINFQQFDLAETKRQQKIQHREEIRYRLSKVAFPCQSSLTPEMEAEMTRRANFVADSISQALSKLLNQ